MSCNERTTQEQYETWDRSEEKVQQQRKIKY